MKRVTLIIPLAVIIALAAFSSSCNKNEKLLNKKNQVHHGEFASFSNMPTVANGMLCFDNEDHVADYLAYLDSVVVSDTTDPNDTLEGDEKLHAIEMQLGYTSLRKITYDAFEILNETGWDDIDDIPEVHFIRSSTQRSIYNSDGDVKVGDAIMHLINKDHAIMILDGSLTTLADVHQISSTYTEADLYDVCSILPDVHLIYLGFPSLHLGGREAAHKGTADTFWKTEFGIRNQWDWHMCNSNRNYALTNVKLITDIHNPLNLYNSGDGLVVEVDWGDGTVQTYSMTVTKSVRNIFGNHQPVIHWPTTPYHSYPNPGQYTIRIKVKRPYHGGYVADGKWDFTAPDYGCAAKSKYKEEKVYTSDGQRAIRCIIEVGNHWLTGRFAHALTEAQEWKNNKWRKTKATQVVAQMTFDSYDDCNNPPNGTVNRAEWANDKKEAKARQGLRYPYDKYTVIYSNHRIWHNGGYRSHDMNVTACD